MLLATKLNRQLKTELAVFAYARNISLVVTVWLLGLAWVADKAVLADMYYAAVGFAAVVTVAVVIRCEGLRLRSCGNKYRDFIVLYYLSYKTSSDMGEISDEVAEKWDRLPTATRSDIVRKLTNFMGLSFAAWIGILLYVPSIVTALYSLVNVG